MREEPTPEEDPIYSLNSAWIDLMDEMFPENLPSRV